jgi:SAM-dependent methyltransferase
MQLTKIVKKIQLLYSNSTETPTSFDLAREIVGLLTVDWKNPDLKILDPGCGRGTFLLAVMERLELEGHSRKHIITNMLWGVDISPVQSMIARKALSLAKNVKSNIFCDDTLIRKFNMEFDVVIGNPPYQKTAEHGKKVNDNLWAPFTFKAWSLLKEDGILAFVTPDNWRTPTNDFRTEGKSILKEIIKPYRTIAVNLNEAERHFDVGSTISYFVVQKTADATNKSTIISNWGQSIIDLNSLPTIPKDLSTHGLNIFSKVTGTEGPRWSFVQKQTKLNKSLDIVEIKDDRHLIPLFDSFGGKDVKFCDKQGEDHNSPKAMITYVGKYSVMVDNGNVTPAQHVHRQILKDTDLESAKSQLESKLYKFIIEGNRANQYIEKHIPNMMPQLDLNKVWTDLDVYTHFGLTQEEIDYVEANVK